MSLRRFVYYSAVAGGWAAFAAWLAAEAVLFRGGPTTPRADIAAMALAGAAIGAAFTLVSRASNAPWRRQLQRLPLAVLVGALGGTLGGTLGEGIYLYLGAPAGGEESTTWLLTLARPLGLMVVGLGIGAADGLCDRSWRKVRNGLLGGALGGLLAGFLFDPACGAGGGMFGRAVAFVILGLAVGAMTGLAYVVLREAWLTVLDGYRPGRQLILTEKVTVLGRGEHLPLPFAGRADKDLEAEHVRITRLSDGRYTVEDNATRLGTQHNHQPLSQPAVLRDGDVIRLGANIVRFHQRQRGRGETEPSATRAGERALPQPPVPGAAAPASPTVIRWKPPPIAAKKSAPPAPPPGEQGPRLPPPPPPPPPQTPRSE